MQAIREGQKGHESLLQQDNPLRYPALIASNPSSCFFMTHFFLIELSLSHCISFLIPGESDVL